MQGFDNETRSLPEELLSRMLEPSRLLGFYQGFPIFDGSTGFAKLQSLLGIHVNPETIMISTPLESRDQNGTGWAPEVTRQHK